MVVSNDVNNQYSSTISILPITSSTKRIYPFEVFVLKGTGNLPKDSKIKADQIRTIDTARIIKEIGNFPSHLMDEVAEAIGIHLDIVIKIRQ